MPNYYKGEGRKMSIENSFGGQKAEWNVKIRGRRMGFRQEICYNEKSSGEGISLFPNG